MTDTPRPAREDLCRSAPFTLTRADEGSDGLTLDGYGAVFDTPTQIDSWEGSFEEVLARGAFRKSLRERTPRMQFDHGYHPLIGSIPIGRITEISEDDRGLHVVGRLSNNWLIEPVRDAIAEGGIDGMSFRFSVIQEDWRDNTGKPVKDTELWDLLYSAGERGPLRRTLKEVKVTEVGPVVWPAYEETSVGVRSKVTIDLAKLKEPAQRKELARAVFMLDAVTREAATIPTPEPPEPPETSNPTDDSNTDGPHSNQESASDHAPAPVTTDDTSSGEHPSSPPEPANPVERAASIRQRFRAVTDRYLTATAPAKTKEGA